MKEEALIYENEFSMSKMFYIGIKRLFDILFSMIGVLVVIPVGIVTKIAYLLNGDTNSIVYKQKRLGKNGKYIYIYKFRTMVVDAEAILAKWLAENPKIREEYYKNRKLDNDPRITKTGQFLRKTSLDELPQFINIFLGDMSFIGPRPVLDDEVENYGSDTSKFLSVRPGLTGYWACNGRSCTSYEKRKKLELYYVEHCSLWLDMKIIVLTVVRVLQGEGAQ